MDGWGGAVLSATCSLHAPSAANVCVCVCVCVTERALQTDTGLLSEPVAELGQMEYQLLKFFTLL